MMKGGNVAKAHKRLWMHSDGIIVDKIENSCAPITAPGTEYSINPVFREHRINVTGAHFVAAAQVSIRRKHTLTADDCVSAGFKPGDPPVDFGPVGGRTSR